VQHFFLSAVAHVSPAQEIPSGEPLAVVPVDPPQRAAPSVESHLAAAPATTVNAALLVGQVITQESYPVAGVTSPRADTVVAVGVVVVHPSVVQSPALVLAVQVFTVHPTPSAKVW